MRACKCFAVNLFCAKIVKKGGKIVQNFLQNMWKKLCKICEKIEQKIDQKI